MGLKQKIAPAVIALITSEQRLKRRRQSAEKKRIKQGRPHQVYFYHQVDDPYSSLLLKVLPQLAQQYELQVILKPVILEKNDRFFPQPELLKDYALNDATRLAKRHGLDFKDSRTVDSKQSGLLPYPPDGALLSATEQLLNCSELSEALKITDAYWRGEYDDRKTGVESSHSPAVFDTLKQHQKDLERKGHYYSGMLFYEGEWYWGLDRLDYLEARLSELGLASTKPSVSSPPPPSSTSLAGKHHGTDSLDMFFSFRSPYSYLALQRTFSLADQYQIRLNLRPVLPMVMRGMKVPRSKRMYIVLDAKREALKYGIPFGKICDPLGSGVERALALFPLAKEQGLEREYALSLMQGAWAEGVDLASDSGLKSCIERAGLDWSKCSAKTADNEWRTWAEANREDMIKMGCWGVPSFRLGADVVWGQDRLWYLENCLSSQTESELS